MLIYSDPPPGLSHRPECAPTRFAAWEEKKKKNHNSNEASRKETDDFQISCKEKRDEVTGMGKGIKGQGWVGWTDGETGRESLDTMGRRGRGGERCFYWRGAKSREIR